MTIKTAGTLNLLACLLAVAMAPVLPAQEYRYDHLANLPFKEGYIPKERHADAA